MFANICKCLEIFWNMGMWYLPLPSHPPSGPPPLPSPPPSEFPPLPSFLSLPYSSPPHPSPSESLPLSGWVWVALSLVPRGNTMAFLLALWFHTNFVLLIANYIDHIPPACSLLVFQIHCGLVAQHEPIKGKVPSSNPAYVVFAFVFVVNYLQRFSKVLKWFVMQQTCFVFLGFAIFQNIWKDIKTLSKLCKAFMA